MESVFHFFTHIWVHQLNNHLITFSPVPGAVCPSEFVHEQMWPALLSPGQPSAVSFEEEVLFSLSLIIKFHLSSRLVNPRQIIA